MTTEAFVEKCGPILVAIGRGGVAPLGLEAKLRREFVVAAIHPRDTRAQAWAVGALIRREGVGEDFIHARAHAGEHAAKALDDAVGRGGGVAFEFVGALHGSPHLGGAVEEIGPPAAELAGRAVIVHRRILDVSNCGAGNECGSEGEEEAFHR